MLRPNQGFTYNKFEKPNDWPKIDKTFDYKIESGKLLSGNEHIYLNGPVTYNIVGNPTIVDGIVTDFTTTSYLMTNLQFDFSQTDYEFVIRATPHAVSTRVAAILGVYGGGLRIYFKQDSIECYPGNNTGLVVHSTFDVSSFYYVRLRRKGSVYTLDYSLDGINYTGARSVTSQQHSSSNLFIRFGYYSGDGWDPLDGKIDLNHTYIKVNDRLWFYGKNYTTYNMVPVPKGLEYNNTTTPEIGWVYTDTSPVKGPVNYTVVGEATITSGVVSNFSENNYIQLNNSQVSNIYSFESCIKIKFSPENLRGWFYQFGWFALSKYGDGNLEFLYRNGGDSWQAIRGAGTQTNISNTWIWIKAGCQNSTAYLSYSFDGKSYTTIGTNQYNLSTAQINANSPLGKSDSSRDLGNGSIDLNETYFIVNGKLWFGNYSMFQNFISVPEGTMIGKDDTHSLAVETYQDKGVVDYTVIGNPTIVDGVASGFSGSDYLMTSLPFNPHSSNWELVCSFIYQPSVGLFGSTTGRDYQGITLVFNNNKLRWCLSSTGLSWDIVGARIVGESLQNGVKYKVKISYNGTQYNLFLSTENSDYILIDSQISSTPIFESSSGIGFGNNYIGANQFFNGSIDLKSTYIMINGEYWFKPYPTMYSKIVGPVDYTVVGSPTITNGIVSDFSQNDYPSINSSVNIKNITETMFKLYIDTSTIGDNQNFTLLQDGTRVQYFFNKYLTYGVNMTIYVAGAGHTSTSRNIPTDTWFYLKTTYDGTTYKAFKSLDKITWEQIMSFDVDLSSQADSTSFRIGSSPYSAEVYFRGSIDLNNTYIKVNRSLWLGKEDWTPSIYTDNAIYLLTGHKSDYSQYNELDFTPEITDNTTYSVSIDNQEIFTGMSSGTHIEWDKLALTTGYNITTPSALKTHVIKISPTDNTKNITKYYCDSNYVIKDGKLVWADPRLALSGPVNYGIVGSPTIVDNIITQANASNYVNITSADIPYTQYWEFVTYVQLGVLTHSAYGISNVNDVNGKARWQIGTNGTRLRFIAAYDNGWAVDITCPTNFSANDWIYIKLNFTSTTRTFALYSSVDGVNWTNEATVSPQVYEDGTGNILRLMNDPHLYPAFLSMDLNKTYIKTDESLWFYGKNYATSNIAPVPAGFTYGTTTTPSIGYVDMRTQTFTASPEGATIGKDE